jgi:hypothetical protein
MRDDSILATSPASDRATCGLGNVSMSAECGIVVEVSRDVIAAVSGLPNAGILSYNVPQMFIVCFCEICEASFTVEVMEISSCQSADEDEEQTKKDSFQR